MHFKRALTMIVMLMLVFGTGTAQAEKKIVHDAEYYVLVAQNGERWAA